MIQQTMDHEEMIDQMFFKNLSLWEEIISYVNDPFRPLDFWNIEECPHELQYEVWEEHAPEFDSDQDPSKLFDLFVNFIVMYKFIYEEEIVKMFALSIRRHVGYWY